VGSVSAHQLPADRLNDVVHVDRHAACVRPQADIDLLGSEEPVYDLGGSMDKESDRCGFVDGQLAHPDDMSFRSDDQRAYAKRSDAMFNSAPPELRDNTAGEWRATVVQIARQASGNAVHKPSLSTSDQRVAYSRVPCLCPERGARSSSIHPRAVAPALRTADHADERIHPPGA
jgi:hypothetical protein